MDDPLLRRVFLRGAATAAELAAALGVSQPTISRRLKSLQQSGSVVMIGRARSARYSLVRSIPALRPPYPMPLYEIDERGGAHLRGECTPLSPAGTLVRGSPLPFRPFSDIEETVFPGAPFYLEYLRPEGFLGRNLARRLADDSGFARDPRDWDEDQMFRFLVGHGADLPGALLLGRSALETALRHEPQPIGQVEQATAFTRLAEESLAGAPPGSSAGGEQPKFTAYLAGAQGTPGLPCNCKVFSRR